MSFQAKRELLRQIAPRYQTAPHGQRSVILDEFVAATGYARKYAIRLLHSPVRAPAPIHRTRTAQTMTSVFPCHSRPSQGRTEAFLIGGSDSAGPMYLDCGDGGAGDTLLIGWLPLRGSGRRR